MPDAVVVELPAALVALFPGSVRRVEVAAGTVAEAIDAIDARWPGMRDRICDSRPDIRRHMRVFVDGERATLATDLPEHVDLLLLDGAKSLYGDILQLVESRLRPGALIVADNADYCPDYLAHVGAVANVYITMPFTDDVELSIRLG